MPGTVKRSGIGVTVVALRLLFGTLLPAQAQDAAINYVHDNLDRLTAVIDQQGNVAIYTYDAVGNLLRIDRVNAADNPSALAITFVTPSRGRVGAAVQIFGKGFGATPALNDVRFNGTPATVTEAAPNRLLTSVPSGATTGYVTVAVSPLTATSPSQFSIGGVLAVTPATATVWAGATTQFQATQDGAPMSTVTWAVNGITGGDALIGTIATDGTYSVPSRIFLDTATITITATDRDDRTISASATVTILSAPGMVGAKLVSVLITPPDARTVNQTVGSIISALITPADTQTVDRTIGDQVSAAVAPVITGMSPAVASRGATGVTLTLTGAGFAGANQVQFFAPSGSAFSNDSAITVTNLNAAPDGTQATLNINVGSAAILGGHVVRITAGGTTSTAGGTSANVFTVNP
jgi:YD repeat-containing protein